MENNTFGNYTRAFEFLGENTYDLNGCETKYSSNPDTRDAYREIENLITKYSDLKEEIKNLKARLYLMEKGENNVKEN